MATWKRILSTGETLADLGGGEGTTFLRKDGTWAAANNYTFPYTVSATAGNSTIVQRSSSGYIFANYLNTTANDVTTGVTKVMVETGDDNYIRHGSAAAIRTFINVANGATNTSAPHYTSAIAVGAGGLTEQNFTTTLKNKLDAVTGTNTGDVCTTNHANAGYLTSQTDSQTLSVDGTTVSISGGNSITTQDTNTNTQLSPTQVRSNFSGGTNITINSSGVIATSANNYVLPTNLAGDDINVDTGALTGATVISDLDFNITTNTSGLVTDANGAVSTRTLTLANLGYSGAVDANNFTYSLPAGSSSTRGGFKIGFSESGKNYPVELSSEKMYVNVPWTDTTQTTISGNAGSATVLANTRSFRTNLASTSSASFNGSQNPDLGVTGTLSANNGGTGLTSTSTLLNSNVNKTHVNNLSITQVGVISSGQWRGTTVAASYGGTGLTSISTLLNSNVTSVSGSSGTFTSTTQNSQFNSIGVGVAGSTTAGEIRATNEVTAYYSDDRLKTKSGNIKNALDKVISLNGFHYKPNKVAGKLGYDTSSKKVGVSAQEVLKVLPEAVVPAPIDPKYHTVQYEKLIPLLIESIKELTAKVKRLENGDN